MWRKSISELAVARSLRRWHPAYMVALLALVALLGQSIAVYGQEDEPRSGQSVPEVASLGQEAIEVVNSGTPTLLANPAFTTLPGAVIDLVVPAGHLDLLVARFAAESACYGGGAGQYCTVRILLNNVEMNPVVGTDFAFDSTNNGSETSASWESHAMERSRCVGPGTYRLVVQRRTTGAATTIRLDDWSFSVERSHGCTSS